jgi:aspartyl-tRNA(Asn)/glutamyl-tRNA(Gln) amidotransferase subunit A
LSLLLGLTAHELQGLLVKQEISSEDLVKEHLNKIKKVEGELHAFVTIAEKEALQAAQKVDEKRSRGEELSPLAGIPMALSDNILTAGIKTTCSSRMLENFIPPYSATVVEKLQAADTVLLGKCNLDEFAQGATTKNSAFGATYNPHELKAVPGGACGGAAAAVAAEEVVFSLGTDASGDLRQPASFCGVIGLKPTYGSVSRYGVVTGASSLDQVGILTKDMTDCALVLNAISGHDPHDSMSIALAENEDYTGSLLNDVKGIKIGIPQEYLQAVDPEIITQLQEAVAKLEELGASCEKVTMPYRDAVLSTYQIIAAAEGSSNLARFDGVRYGFRVETEDLDTLYKKTRGQGFGTEVKKNIILGTYVLSSEQYEAYYLKALKVRTLIKDAIEKLFQDYDCLLLPTTPTVAFAFQDERANTLARDLDIWTCPANLAGIPALSLPWGMVKGLPVGLQFWGRAFAEKTLLRIGFALEQNTNRTRLSLKGKGVC